MYYIGGKGHKLGLRRNRNYSTSYAKLFMAVGVDTHIHAGMGN